VFVEVKKIDSCYTKKNFFLNTAKKKRGRKTQNFFFDAHIKRKSFCFVVLLHFNIFLFDFFSFFLKKDIAHEEEKKSKKKKKSFDSVERKGFFVGYTQKKKEKIDKKILHIYFFP
jgi:hypothetical protein